MQKIASLERFTVPLGGQDVELQHVDFETGGMSFLRIRIREGKRFTIFDIDPATAKAWGGAMEAWAREQLAKPGAG